jgi:hypothetical protein
MPALPLLNYTQQKNFDSCPKLDKKQRLRYFAINDAIIMMQLLSTWIECTTL